MIEWVESRNNLMVPMQNGVLLCSSIDPVAEAKKWVEKYIADINEYEVIFILGLAGGFHIKQLAQAIPDTEIIVIESLKPLEKELLSRRGPLQDNVTILAGYSINELKQNVYFRAGVKSIYRILKYPTSCRLNSDYYENVERLLCGHDYESLQFHLDGRQHLKSLFDEINLKKECSDTENITILDVEKSIRKKNKELSRDAMIFMTLRELVR